MRKVIANEWMTLDGVVQAPSYADEDVTGTTSPDKLPDCDTADSLDHPVYPQYDQAT